MSELTTIGARILALNFDNLPDGIGAIIDVQSWAMSILQKTEYREPNPEFLSTMIALLTITAPTIEEIFAQANIKKIQEMIPDIPGAGTGPIEITDLYVAPSDFETGNPSYVILTAVSLDSGESWKATTGATNVQATLIALLMHGVWPIRCQIKRGDGKDKGGRHLLFVLPPD